MARDKEIELKKAYLKSYEKAVRRMERSKLRLEEIRRGVICPSVANDGMPRASRPSDLSNYAVLLEREEKRYSEYRDRCIQKCKEIFDRIEKLDSEDEKDILVCRYIKLLKWSDIYATTGYGHTWVSKVHKDALKHFTI